MNKFKIIDAKIKETDDSNPCEIMLVAADLYLFSSLYKL